MFTQQSHSRIPLRYIRATGMLVARMKRSGIRGTELKGIRQQFREVV